MDVPLGSDRRSNLLAVSRPPSAAIPVLLAGTAALPAHRSGWCSKIVELGHTIRIEADNLAVENVLMPAQSFAYALGQVGKAAVVELPTGDEASYLSPKIQSGWSKGSGTLASRMGATVGKCTICFHYPVPSTRSRGQLGSGRWRDGVSSLAGNRNCSRGPV